MSVKTTIKVQRPEGHVETLDISDKFPRGISDPMFETIKQATKDAGRGEALSYDVEHKISEQDLAEVKAYDRKCKWFERHGFSEHEINA